jgi:endonuclease/exonuclease/phosphatase family metal-dependent hydrolase
MVRYAIDKLTVEQASDGGVWTGVVDDPAWSVFGPSPSTRAVILMGDLNFRPATEEYTLFVGNLNQQHGRITRRNGFVDAYVAAGHAEGSGDTHDNGGRIDHIMVWAPMREGIGSVSIDNAATGSDHYPVWMEFDESQLPVRDDF